MNGLEKGNDPYPLTPFSMRTNASYGYGGDGDKVNTRIYVKYTYMDKEDDES